MKNKLAQVKNSIFVRSHFMHIYTAAHPSIDEDEVFC